MLLNVEIALSGAKATDTAPAIAEKRAPQFRYLARASLVQKVRRLRRKERKEGVARMGEGVLDTPRHKT